MDKKYDDEIAINFDEKRKRINSQFEELRKKTNQKLDNLYVDEDVDTGIDVENSKDEKVEEKELEKLRKETNEKINNLREKKDKDIQEFSNYIDEKSKEEVEEKEETSLKKTSGIGRFFAKIKAKFNKVFAIRAAIVAGTAVLAVGGGVAASNSKKAKPENAKGRENTTDETKKFSDDMFRTKITPLQKEAANIVERTIAEDENMSRENDFREELSNQTVGSDKVPEAPTISDDTLREAMSKVGIDPDEAENPNYVPIHEPVSKDIESPTQEVKIEFENETKQDSTQKDKNKEPKKDLSDVKEATGATEVVKPTISEVTKKDETKTDETKTEETKIEDKGTVIKKDSDVTIVVTPEGETIKQEKDKDGNIKKEEHYVDENPFER